MKLIIALVAAMGLSFAALGSISQGEALAATDFPVQEANAAITITSQPGSDPEYLYSPTDVSAKVGQAISITNNDSAGVHSVTAKDGTFGVDVPPKSTVTLTISKAGKYQYYCTYHPAQHNPASISVS